MFYKTTYRANMFSDPMKKIVKQILQEDQVVLFLKRKYVCADGSEMLNVIDSSGTICYVYSDYLKKI